MSKRSQRKKKQPPRTKGSPKGKGSFQQLYERACELAQGGKPEEARRLYKELGRKAPDARRRALVANDLAALAALVGDAEAARKGFRAALAIDAGCEPARANLALLEAGAPETPTEATATRPPAAPAKTPEPGTRTRVALLSFLFNWPSTGGGTVHTFELARFLARAGFEVRHIYARYPAWGIGGVEGALPFPNEALAFEDPAWNAPDIQARFRQAVEAFAPDHVLITDSWNSKPLLAEAVRGYPYILRFQAMECFCPLNNVRLLPDQGGRFRQCNLHQLATPQECARCLQERGRHSGGLHQAERALSGVGTATYHERLLRAFREAEAVLVVNPLHEAMVSPYTGCVRVVTAGMDPARFPWPWPGEGEGGQGAGKPGGRLTVFFAGLVDEVMKGFDVLHEACARLWRRRQDFELVATADPPGPVDPFTRYIGWQSQADLPRHLRAADLLAMPTVAQEALGRTAVEAMAVGRPVVASRLGGLPFTVIDGATGLLCEPGDADDLARKLEMLLDDPGLRQRLGLAGRRRFEEHYSWDVIIERHYRPLLSRRPVAAT
jgi:glycosyltransferase involved in cell wall biosynthesis